MLKKKIIALGVVALAASLLAAPSAQAGAKPASKANVGDECIVGALCFVKGEMQIPNRKIVVGNPAIIKGDVSDNMINWKSKGTELYQELPVECRTLMKECSPLSEIEKNRKGHTNIAIS